MEYTVEQVAEALKVTPRTVRNLIERGRFPGAYKIDPQSERSTWRIPEDDLVQFKERQHESV